MIHMPDRGKIFFGWWIVGASFMIFFYMSGTIILGFTAFFEPIAAEMGWSYTQISLASSLRGLEAGLLAPVTGILVDRWGPRKLVFSGGILMAAGSYFLSTVDSLAMFYAAYLIIALGTSCCSYTVQMAAAANWFRRKMGLASGIMSAGVGFGGLIIPIMVYLIVIYGWRTTMALISAGTLVIVLPLSLLFRRNPEDYGYYPDGDCEVEVNENTKIVSTSTMESSVTFSQAKKSLTFWKIIISLVLLHTVVSALTVHIMPYLSSVGIARFKSGFVVTLYPIISIAGRIGAGWLGDRYGKKPVLATAFFLIGLGFFCLSYITESMTLILIPFVLLYSTGFGSAGALRPSLVREYFGRSHFGTILGCIMGMAMIGSMTGPTLTGWVYDKQGGYQGIWLIAAGISFASLFLILTISPLSSGTETPVKDDR